jgi:hypothetical protein
MSWPRPPAGLSTAVLAGVALPAPADSGKPAVNAAVLLDGGRLLLEQHKRLLPFYDVFDEQRYFAPSRSQQVVELDGVRWPSPSARTPGTTRTSGRAASTPSIRWKS